MIKNTNRLVVTAFAMLMVVSASMTAYATECDMDSRARNIEDVASVVSENVARITGTPRGMVISSVELSITDLGGGTAQLFGEVLCHEAMEKIKLNLYLDQWISEENDWMQLEKFEFNWLAEDYPNEDLTMAYAYVNASNLDRGENYRVRGIAGAWDLDSDLYEVWSEETPSILVE